MPVAWGFSPTWESPISITAKGTLFRLTDTKVLAIPSSNCFPLIGGLVVAVWRDRNVDGVLKTFLKESKAWLTLRENLWHKYKAAIIEERVAQEHLSWALALSRQRLCLPSLARSSTRKSRRRTSTH